MGRSRTMGVRRTTVELSHLIMDPSFNPSHADGGDELNL